MLEYCEGMVALVSPLFFQLASYFWIIVNSMIIWAYLSKLFWKLAIIRTIINRGFLMTVNLVEQNYIDF